MVLYRVNAPLEEHWSHSSEEGGRLIGEACHFVDVLQYITGSRPKRVFAGGVPVGGTIAHEENFSFTIEYEDGSLGTVFYNGLGNFRLPKEYIEIYGDGNIMRLDNFKEAKFFGPQRTENLSLSKQNKGYEEELAALIQAMRSGQPSPISLDELYVSHTTTFKAAEALRTGESIRLAWE
jgi:polar amino acid transport system substrate-binding protein